MMLRAGLTGGIASGKTTVARMLRARGFLVLEADPLGHEFLEPGQQAYAEVVREFGTDILLPGGLVDRAKLGEIIFSDAARRARINQILHPPILQVIRTWFGAIDHPGGPPLAFVEAALIFEAGFNQELDKVVVCWSTAEQQLERLKSRGLSEREALMRITSQMPIDEKKKRADVVIDCSASFDETERQVDQALAQLREMKK